jgi:hypothetical protein
MAVPIPMQRGTRPVIASLREPIAIERLLGKIR